MPYELTAAQAAVLRILSASSENILSQEALWEQCKISPQVLASSLEDLTGKGLVLHQGAGYQLSPSEKEELYYYNTI